MAEIIRMPLLSDTMKEGIIAEWHKNIGDYVKADDVIADVETDKATMEVMPYLEGTLLYIGVEKGKSVPVNGIMAIIGMPGENIQTLLDAEYGRALPETIMKEKIVEQDINNTISITTPNDEHLKASPLAKKLAIDKGVDIQKIKGSGDGGRIIKRDINDIKNNDEPKHTGYIQESKNVDLQVVAVEIPSQVINKVQNNIPTQTNLEYTDLPLNQIRKIIAQKLTESKINAPHFYLHSTITMDNIIDARKRINALSSVKISFNDIIIKACALALTKHPVVNSSWMGDFIRQNHVINIGTAVAIEDGLIVPVIKNANLKTLTEIAQDSAILIEKARTKKIQPNEFTGNTFTISNLGMMDIEDFTAIINPPDSCILAVGKIGPSPVVENNNVVIRQLMKVTLSCDHRVVDGAKGAAFLKTLKQFLEYPVTMIV